MTGSCTRWKKSARSLASPGRGSDRSSRRLWRSSAIPPGHSACATTSTRDSGSEGRQQGTFLEFEPLLEMDDRAVLRRGLEGDAVHQQLHQDDAATAVTFEHRLGPAGVPDVDAVTLVDNPDVAGLLDEADPHLVVVLSVGVLDDVGARLRECQGDVPLAIGRHA